MLTWQENNKLPYQLMPVDDFALLLSSRRIGLSDAELASCFTTDPAESPIHVLRWGVLGDTWPYFRPNYTNMEQARQQTGAQEVGRGPKLNPKLQTFEVAVFCAT